MLRLLAILATISWANVSALEVRPLPTVLRPVAGGARAWDTRHFRITSEVAVPERDLLRLAAVADATARAVGKHPVPWFDPPRDERPKLVILRDAAHYERAGGTPGTAGMYLWQRRAVVLDAGHLFPPTEGHDGLKPLPDEAILIHEIVHLCMHGSQGGMPQWFAEGVCEYFAAAHRSGGVFRFDDMDRGIRDHLRSRFGRDAEVVPALRVAPIIDLDSRAWIAFMLKLPPEQRYHGYVTALLLTHYHLHAEVRRREILDAFSSRPPEVPGSFRELATSSASVEDQLTRYWRPKGLKVQFADPTRPPASD